MSELSDDVIVVNDVVFKDGKLICTLLQSVAHDLRISEINIRWICFDIQSRSFVEQIIAYQGEWHLLQGEPLAVEVNLPKFSQPLSKVELSIPNATVKFDGELAANLGRIFPLNDKQYEQIFSRKPYRWGGIHTEYFVSDQITRWYRGVSAYRCGAAVVKAYKAIEIGSAPLILSAEQTAISALQWVERCSIDWRPRRNKEHLRISVLTALWHLQLARGDIESLSETLERIYQETGKIQNFFTPAFLISKALLLYGFIKYKRGDLTGASNVWQTCINVFQYAVRDSDPSKPTLFMELEVSHHAACLAIHGLKEIAGGNKDIYARLKIDLKTVVAASVRVSGSPRTRMYTLLDRELKTEEAPDTRP